MLCVGRNAEVKGNDVSIHTIVSPEEAADRLAIGELIDAYAYCADGRDAEGQMALFLPSARFVVYMDPRSSEPTMDLSSRAELAPVFDNLNVYEATTHFNGQRTITLEGDRAEGETYCLAHHVSADGDSRSLMIASIRYLDTFTKSEGMWLFAERRLYVDWTDTRPILDSAS
jgi:SnoaL-like domain